MIGNSNRTAGLNKVWITRIHFFLRNIKSRETYTYSIILRLDINYITILFFIYRAKLSVRQSKPIDRHSPMRKIIISPCNYAARIICNNPLPSSSAYCFPTRSIEMAFDRISRRDRIKISGPLSDSLLSLASDL